MVCMAMGLWMLHRNLTASLRRDLELETWRNMSCTVEHLMGQHGYLSQLEVPDQSAAEEIRFLLDTTCGEQTGLLLVDCNWRTLSHFNAGDAALAPHAPLRRSNWKPAADSSNVESAVDGHTDVGRLGMPNGTHLAVCTSLGAGRGFMFVHHPVAAIEAEAAALARPLSAIGAVTMFWIFVVLALAVYIICGRMFDRAKRSANRSKSDILRHAQRVLRTRDAIVFGLAKLAESRDPETGGHLERICAYATTFASALRRNPEFGKTVDSSFVRLIGISAAVHDIGKVGVPDNVLLKSEGLTDDEWVAMKTHTIIGADCLREIEQRLGGSNFLRMAREIAASHHERWDGSGYPRGLAGENIPLAARIVAICDVYDALSSRRVYKSAMSHEHCVEIIRRGAGVQFDPGLIEVWLTIEQTFHEIFTHFGADPDLEDSTVFDGSEAGEYGETTESETLAGDDTDAARELANTV